MIKVLHGISKWGLMLWTCLWVVIIALMAIGMFATGTTEPVTEDTAGIMAMASVMGFVVCGFIWFGPSVVMALVMYITRPSAWPDKEKVVHHHHHPPAQVEPEPPAAAQ